MKYTIDAKEKRLGRVASQAAIILMGKNRTDFARNANPDDTSVEIINASKINLHPKKLSQKTYAKYSGYPGGLKLLTLENVLQKKSTAKNIYRRSGVEKHP